MLETLDVRVDVTPWLFDALFCDGQFQKGFDRYAHDYEHSIRTAGIGLTGKTSSMRAPFGLFVHEIETMKIET